MTYRVKLIFILFFFSICLKGQTRLDLTKYYIDYEEWYCLNTFYDSLYNPNFKPDLLLIKADTSNLEDIYQLNIELHKFEVNSRSKTIHLKGRIKGGWYGGHGSEVLIMTANRIDTTLKIGVLSHNIPDYSYHPKKIVNCIKFSDIDFCYSDFALENTKENREFSCNLQIDKKEFLVFALQGCYAYMFDLKKLEKAFAKTKYCNQNKRNR